MVAAPGGVPFSPLSPNAADVWHRHRFAAVPSFYPYRSGSDSGAPHFCSQCGLFSPRRRSRPCAAVLVRQSELGVVVGAPAAALPHFARVQRLPRFQLYLPVPQSTTTSHVIPSQIRRESRPGPHLLPVPPPPPADGDPTLSFPAPPPPSGSAVVPADPPNCGSADAPQYRPCCPS